MTSLQGLRLLGPALPLAECACPSSHGCAGHALQCRGCAWCLSNEGQPSNAVVRTGGHRIAAFVGQSGGASAADGGEIVTRSSDARPLPMARTPYIRCAASDRVRV